MNFYLNIKDSENKHFQFYTTNFETFDFIFICSMQKEGLKIVDLCS